MDVDVDLIGCVGVGLGGIYVCRCGILYAPMLGVVFYAELVSMTSSSYPSSCSPLDMLYKTLLAENCQNLEMAAIRRNV